MLKILCFFGFHQWRDYLGDGPFGYSSHEYQFCKTCKNIEKK